MDQFIFHMYVSCDKTFLLISEFSKIDSNCQGSFDKSPQRGPQFSCFDHIHPTLPWVALTHIEMYPRQVHTLRISRANACIFEKKLNESEMMFFGVLSIFVILVEVRHLIYETFLTHLGLQLFLSLFVCIPPDKTFPFVQKNLTLAPWRLTYI